jgi:hypothetical protein
VAVPVMYHARDKFNPRQATEGCQDTLHGQEQNSGASRPAEEESRQQVVGNGYLAQKWRARRSEHIPVPFELVRSFLRIWQLCSAGQRGFILSEHFFQTSRTVTEAACKARHVHRQAPGSGHRGKLHHAPTVTPGENRMTAIRQTSRG